MGHWTGWQPGLWVLHGWCPQGCFEKHRLHSTQPTAQGAPSRCGGCDAEVLCARHVLSHPHSKSTAYAEEPEMGRAEGQ